MAFCQSKDLLEVQTLQEIDSVFNPSVVDLGEGMTPTKPKVEQGNRNLLPFVLSTAKLSEQHSPMTNP